MMVLHGQRRRRHQEGHHAIPDHACKERDRYRRLPQDHWQGTTALAPFRMR
jgi:hypothetical protein